MRAYIKKLQSKSEDTRKLIFTASLIISMSIVVLIWVYSLGVRFGNPEVKVQANEDIKPFKLFTNSISDVYKNMSASVGKIYTSNSISNTVTEVKNYNEEIKAVSDKQIDLIPVEYTN